MCGRGVKVSSGSEGGEGMTDSYLHLNGYLPVLDLCGAACQHMSAVCAYGEGGGGGEGADGEEGGCHGRCDCVLRR